MNTKTPIQYSLIGHLIKRFLHTKLGMRVGFYLHVKGFNRVGAIIIRADGTKEFLGFSYNSRVNKGADLTGSLLMATAFNSITSAGAPKYIALSTSSLTPDKGDTTLSGETSSYNMGRVAGTIGGYTGPSTLDGAASNTITHTFTAGGSITIVSAALFDAASSGNLFVEANLSSSAVLNNGDTLAITWTVNY